MCVAKSEKKIKRNDRRTTTIFEVVIGVVVLLLATTPITSSKRNFRVDFCKSWTAGIKNLARARNFKSRQSTTL